MSAELKTPKKLNLLFNVSAPCVRFKKARYERKGRLIQGGGLSRGLRACEVHWPRASLGVHRWVSGGAFQSATACALLSLAEPQLVPLRRKLRCQRPDKGIHQYKDLLAKFTAVTHCDDAGDPQLESESMCARSDLPVPLQFQRNTVGSRFAASDGRGRVHNDIGERKEPLLGSTDQRPCP